MSNADSQFVVRAACRGDVPVLLEMFKEFAAHVRLEHELRVSEQGLDNGLFSERPAAEALIAERGEQVIGYALFFQTFSTFLTSVGTWLEDLYVRPDHRASGVGRALLARIADRVREQGGDRLEWAVLSWNSPASGFYRHLGSVAMDDLTIHRLDGQALSDLADGAR